MQSVRFPDAPAGLVYPGDPGVPRGTYTTDNNNLAPRLGMVWDISGQATTTVRGAWGVFYDALAGQGDFFQNGVLAPPFTPLVEINSPPASITLSDPLSGRRRSNALPARPDDHRLGARVPDAVRATLQRDGPAAAGKRRRRRGGIRRLARQRTCRSSWRSIRALYSPGQTTVGPRLFPAFSLVRPTFSVARSQYDSLQASARLRATHGVSLLASYTYGHARDHSSGLNIGGEPRPVLPVTIGDPASFDRALALEWGDALFDVRHRLVVSFTAALPSPSPGRILRHVLGGWQLNGIVQTQTGFPVTLTNPQLDIRYLTNRPDAVCDPNARAPHTTDQWFDTSCLGARPLAQTGDRPGNAGRNTIRGPGFSASDLSLIKNITAGGSRRIQLRVEAFNVFNQARFNNPGGAIGTPTFGRITAAADGRVLQLGMKYLF